jgi:glycosyltransferase involved in cell wall biosynthesis
MNDYRRAALVHDFFIQDGGAERCAIELAALLPGAELYTSFFDREVFGERLSTHHVHTWPAQRLLGPTRRFRSLLPFYPAWFSALDLRSYDLVVSSSIAFTKAVRTRRDAFHVSYVYTPMRYAFELDSYLEGSSYGLPARLGARMVRPVLKAWDRRTGRQPDVLVAISATVRDRIRRLWGRDAEVIHPPVDTAEIALSHRDEGYLLVAARLLAYRRIDLAVHAANLSGRELVVVGDGPERKRLQAMAGTSVRFLGHIDRARLLELFAGCHAYLVPGVEDFGIAPVEAMAAGKPVVALARGGATETVVDGVTGLFFENSDADALAAAIDRLDGLTFDPRTLRTHAEGFSADRFHQRWRDLFARLGVDPSLYSGG